MDDFCQKLIRQIQYEFPISDIWRVDSVILAFDNSMIVYWQECRDRFTADFYQSLQQVSNIDDVLNYHTDFLNNCLKDCMLTNPDLLKIVHKLMMVCVTFCNFIQVSCSLGYLCCFFS